MKCSKCKQEKRPSEMSKNTSHPSGYNSTCKACKAEYARGRYKNDPEYRRRHKAHNQRYYDMKTGRRPKEEYSAPVGAEPTVRPDLHTRRSKPPATRDTPPTAPEDNFDGILD